ncbi:ABC transporter ATP-binding protein [Frankia sp. CNm7]|uniref:ABC transporter ATP-binding protein n=1 Tax=Frankia nepalensis TaxID=1836974 RepID=A0A937R8N0_9ACTN|nr:ABC transporter ATP-binding protein [Frankia nepalensis]MBL7500355.1 ABC transporter ATP-binding protein [Frankia nepalensis]MBL7508577.1 ABC transporter ATP-binding protein [Frankia nepalensis]MBL7517797.1 ABC transporter ATP-binding protein [Frankia nepalensis]MBL7627708.1 ABC transporter ATP-binding protein [Frankia nepalensis]
MAALTTTFALETQDLTRTFGEGAGTVQALAGVDLAFPRGSFTAVMGPSGSGKSTFLSCVAGIDRPSAGRVLLAGTDVTSWDEDRLARLRRRRIGFVFQDFQLMPYLTAEQNVGLPWRLSGRRPDRARVRGLLDRVGLADRAHHLPARLSGGQRQRVAIARALVAEPDVILADEPTGALDSATARGVLALLRACVDELGQTVVMVTHDPVAAAYADTVVFLVDGRVAGRIEAPTVDAVAARQAHLDEQAVSR